MEELALLQQKLNSLLKTYSALKADHLALQQAISKQAHVVRDLHTEKENLQKDLASASLSQYGEMLEPGQKERIRQQLDNLLEVLNKNIDLL